MIETTEQKPEIKEEGISDEEMVELFKSETKLGYIENGKFREAGTWKEMMEQAEDRLEHSD